MEKLTGPFKDIIPMFQKYKKSIGYNYDNINNYILIDKILKYNKVTNFDDTKRIFDILVNEEDDLKKQKRNYFALKELYSFMNIIGYKNTYIEKRYYKLETNKTQPLSQKEIDTFFKILDQYCKLNNDNMLPVIFRLIYSSGLRISEAINIKNVDFNRKNGTLLIYKSKNDITRLLVLSNSMLKILDKYFQINDLSNNKYLFEKNNKKIDINYLEKIFNKITTIMGIKSKVHSLRFTFAVNTLNNLYKNKINSKEILYPLSIYMGHQNIKSTEYYLQFTIEYQKKYVTNIIPKGGNNDF